MYSPPFSQVVMDNSNECHLTYSMWGFVSKLLKVQPVLQKFLFPLEVSPDRWWGHVKPFLCSPHHLLLLPSISPLQLQRSSQWARLWSMQHSPLETRTWAALSVPAPTVEGSWIGQVSQKASRGKRDLVQLTYPTKDSISLHYIPPTLS